MNVQAEPKLARWLPRTLRGKLLLAGMLLQTVLLSAVFFVISAILRESAESTLSVSVKTISETINLGISPYATEKRFDVLLDFFSELIADSEDGLQYVVVLDQDKKVLLAVGKTNLRSERASASVRQAIEEGIYHVHQPVLLSGNHVGQVQFGLATTNTSRVLKIMSRSALAVSLGGILLTALALAVYGEKFKQRLDHLINATHAIVQGDYTRRVPEDGHDELSLLAQQFNAMTQAVEVREKKFSAVFNAAPTPMVIFLKIAGQNGLRSFVRIDRNLTATSLFGSLSDDIPEHAPYLTKADREVLMERFEREGRLYGVETTMVLQSGEAHPFLVYGERFNTGNDTYLLMISVDINDLRQAQNHLHQLNRELEQRVAERTAQLEQRNTELGDAIRVIQHTQEQLIRSEKLSSLGSMVAGIAHEMNTPIGNALTVASSWQFENNELRRATESGLKRSALERYLASSNEASDILLRNLERAARLIDSFKALAVGQTGGSRGQFLLSDIAARVSGSMSSLIGEVGAKLVCSIDQDLMMDSYHDELTQVLMHLLSNALIHGVKGMAHGEVVLSAALCDGDKVSIDVIDNGRGIPPEHLDKIFDPFFTTKLGQGGSGLGLNLVYNLVNGLLGGEIQVHSTVGQGTRVTLLLPLHAPYGKPV